MRIKEMVLSLVVMCITFIWNILFNSDNVNVRGYTRKDGTVVSSYSRKMPSVKSSTNYMSNFINVFLYILIPMVMLLMYLIKKIRNKKMKNDSSKIRSSSKKKLNILIGLLVFVLFILYNWSINL